VLSPIEYIKDKLNLKHFIGNLKIEVTPFQILDMLKEYATMYHHNEKSNLNGTVQKPGAARPPEQDEPGTPTG
jgi:hypothetical protein